MCHGRNRVSEHRQASRDQAVQGPRPHDVITLGDFTLGKGTFEPGWRWSDDIKPIAGTESCQVLHTGICLSGKMTVRMDDGTNATMGPGDVVRIEPGHDAWVEGDEPCIFLDTGVAGYAKPQ